MNNKGRTRKELLFGCRLNWRLPWETGKNKYLVTAWNMSAYRDRFRQKQYCMIFVHRPIMRNFDFPFRCKDRKEKYQVAWGKKNKGHRCSTFYPSKIIADEMRHALPLPGRPSDTGWNAQGSPLFKIKLGERPYARAYILYIYIYMTFFWYSFRFIIQREYHPRPTENSDAKRALFICVKINGIKWKVWNVTSAFGEHSAAPKTVKRGYDDQEI